MSLDDLLRRPISGIRPFNELPIDAEIWRQAHSHHHMHRHLHAVAAHRPGIVYGLEVVASRSRPHTIIVAPGVGIDADGQTLIVREPTPLTIEEARQIYVTLAFQRQADRNYAVNIGGAPQYFREIEGRELVISRELPSDKPYLELARIFRSANDAPIKEAANPASPTNDELNLLFRPLAFPHCYADIGVGEMSYIPREGRLWNPNRAGLWNLLREGNGRGFRLQFTGPMVLNTSAGQAAVAEPALLYVAGRTGWRPIPDPEVEGLSRYLSGGGLLVGEAGQGNPDFATDFQALATRLGANLQPVTKGHPLLTAHFIFASTPGGGHTGGTVLADTRAGIVLSTADYGGAWQGDVDRPADPDSRERIRESVEFGLNLVAYAANRRRVRTLEGLE